MQVTNVPYRGAAPALADLVAGQVQAKLDTYTTSVQFIADKRLNAIAVTSASGSSSCPTVQTVMESVPGFEGYLWMGLVAPAGTPQPVLDKLAAATRRAVERADVQARFDKDGRRAGRQSPAAFKAVVSPRDRAMARARQAGRHQGGVTSLAGSAPLVPQVMFFRTAGLRPAHGHDAGLEDRGQMIMR
jgi:tripartite-type tricarboxylate transporter receptor subunit TctC